MRDYTQPGFSWNGLAVCELRRVQIWKSSFQIQPAGSFHFPSTFIHTGRTGHGVMVDSC